MIKLQKPSCYLEYGMLLMILKVFFSISTLFRFSNSFDSILSFASAGFMMMDIYRQKYKKSTLFLYFVIAGLSFYTCLRVGTWNFLITVVTILAVRNKDIDKVINFIYCYSVVLFVSNAVLSVLVYPLGLTNIVTYKNGIAAINFGYGHPNTFSAVLFNILLMWVWLNFDNISKKNLLIFFLAIICNYFIVKTKTTVIIMFLFIIMLIYVKRKKNQLKIIEYIACSIFPILSYIIWEITKNFWLIDLPFEGLFETLTSRFKLGAYALEHFGVTFLGQNLVNIKVKWDPLYGMESFTFDCLYTNLICHYGLFWLICVCCLFFILAKKGNNKINIFIIAWSLYAVTENYGLNVYMSFPILLIVLLFDYNNYLKTHRSEYCNA